MTDNDPTRTPPEHCYYSMGVACEIIGVTPPQLVTLMEAESMSFCYVVDHIGHMNGVKLNRCIDRKNQLVAEIKSAAEAHHAN